MALHRIDGKLTGRDRRIERISAGTIGDDHIIPHSIPGRKVSALIDDSDPRVVHGFVSGYGTDAAYFSNQATTDFVFGGTQTIVGYDGTALGSPGSAVLFRWSGTQIAVLGSTNPDSGVIRVYIDGIETPGRVAIFTGFRLGLFGNYDNPVIDENDTTIPALAGALDFPESGTIYISGELIDYTSRDSNGFYGCTRGAQGTIAAYHSANETIYLWASGLNLSNVSDFATKQVLYYNPLLEPGEHRIVVVVEPEPVTGNSKFYFDGFTTGSLLGSSNIFTQIATVTLDFTTDTNGHCELGSIVARNNDIARLAFLGYTQEDCEDSNTNTMGILGVKYSVDGTPFYYCHNGPPDTDLTWIITFAFIGETI